MPCGECKKRCDAPDCGFEPFYFDTWTDCGTEYEARCKGYLYGDPWVQCAELPCDLCQDFRAYARFCELAAFLGWRF
jgi:hypothetical protein